VPVSFFIQASPRRVGGGPRSIGYVVPGLDGLRYLPATR